MGFFYKIRYWFDRIDEFFCRYLGRNYLCGCGHKAKRKVILKIHDREGIFKMPKDKKYCHKCFAKAAIKCAWCEGTILPGSPITLCTPTKDFQIPEHAVIYSKSPVRLVGCLRWECATGAERRGFWVMPGKVYRVMSPIEMLMANGNEGAVIVGDLGDISKAIPVKEDTDSE